VSVAVLHRGRSVLLAKRSMRKDAWPGVWDFVGGHIEAGEAPEQALVREVREELGVGVLRTHSPFEIVHEDMHLHGWFVDDWSGEIANTAPEEHDEIRFFDIDEFDELDLGDPAYPALVRSVLG
jgi:mutator protein MutT